MIDDFGGRRYVSPTYGLKTGPELTRGPNITPDNVAGDIDLPSVPEDP